MFGWLTERRRRHILDHPFPAAWGEILARNVAVYARLADEQRKRLRDLVQVFVAEKHWEGAGGLVLTDEIRVTIAGQACLLILGRDHDLFARLVSIVVYPSAMMSPQRPVPVRAVMHQPIRGPVAIGGEAYGGDLVLVAWDDALHSGASTTDGRNVVVHEFAHVIDFLDGAADGAPPLASREQSREWAEVCSAAFAALTAALERGEPTFLRAYGATNPAEFFAVATEAFFERPAELERGLPDLYRVLARFYNLDLARL
jgi:Mlc titration factor MtfA (ptsG expression regulator)